MRLPALGLIALLLSGCVTQPPQDVTPPSPCADITTAAFMVCQFYGRYIPMKPFGLPGSTSQSLLSPFFSPTLNELLQETLQQQEDFIADYPEALPPLADGPLFSSNARFPDHFEIANERHFTGERGSTWALVTVRLRHEDSGQQWQDELVLRHTPQGYLIEDFLFPRRGGNGPQRLTDTLRDAFSIDQ
ncbi:hypothetical protein S7S_13710 [Isoalcanivorax pacificus W11-5]|uniref:Lipoprotein n=1 Tax=Isoalcanivorax pacificus W11-5 TaxID=391936 RepID=A0A0B4XLJ7_9GAMM|nr:hypothetical protein [Isoalcanivorax pacificus]AJD49154.1 hypothetical protein S7S_13710 [Isoalcanivorax pacificus W11-5]